MSERSTAALIEDCVHCGFCLPTCPTYALWDEEMDSPRGRIVLMTGERSPAAVTHFDRCLGCMACVTACPSGVRYDLLISRTRAEIPQARGRRLRRRALLGLFTHPGRLRPVAALNALGHRLGLVRRLPGLGRLAPAPRPRRRLPERVPAHGPARGRVGLLQGCVQRVFFGDVNAATARVLSAEGWDVHVPRLPRCCGALAYHEGERDEARALARATVEAFAGDDVVVTNAAGCGSALKEYGELLGEEGAAFAARVRDVSELLHDEPPRAPRHPVPLRVAYHDACHLAHAQGVREAPRALLRAVPGLELLEPAEWELCCGSAGLYNLLQPTAAAELGRRKAANLLATGAEALAAANPGCTLQIQAHLERPLPIMHPVELIDSSIRGEQPGA